MLKKKLGIGAIERDWYIGSFFPVNYYKISSTLIIPDGCNRIGDKAFGCCNSLKEVKIPESVKKIGGYTFWGCKRLKKIIIPEGVVVIRDWAFQWCTKLGEVEIPRGVRKIGKAAFYGCENAVVILKKPQKEFKEIGDNAFWMCKDVKEETGN